jgi:hypothetical protein
MYVVITLCEFYKLILNCHNIDKTYVHIINLPISY